MRRSVALSDTVGFIRDLPHALIEAFQATLQEAADADLLLHVVDGASPELAEQMRRGAARPRRDRRRRRGADRRLQQARSAWTRPSGRAPWSTWSRSNGARVPRVFVSARTGEGLDAAARADRGVRVRPALNARPAASAAVDEADGVGSDGDDVGRTGTYHSHA